MLEIGKLLVCQGVKFFHNLFFYCFDNRYMISIESKTNITIQMGFPLKILISFLKICYFIYCSHCIDNFILLKNLLLCFN